MLTLFVDIDGWKQVELYQAEPVNLTYTFTDVTEINKPASSYSQAFRIPMTKANQDVFGAFGLGHVPSLNYKTRIPARIMRGGVTLMEGFGQIKTFYVQHGKFQDLEFVLFGEVANLSRAIGDAMMQDLDLSAYNFAMNSTNVETALSSTGYGSGRVRLGVVDRFGFGSLHPFNGSLYFTPADFTPFVSVRYLLERIFAEAGLTYESDFFGSASIDDLYLMALAGEQLYTTAIYQTQGFNVGHSTDQTIPIATWTALAMSETTPFYDNISAWSTDTFTAPVTGVYRFQFIATHDASINVSFRVVGSTSGTVYTGTLNAGESAFLEFNVNLTASETVQFEVNAATVGTFDIGAELLSVYFYETNGFTLDLARNLPKLKQIDFVSGLQKSFNLVFIPDRNRPTHFYIEPWSDYMAAGTTKDWTSKLETAKDVTISPTADLQKRKYTWTHAESEDKINAAAKSASGEVYGTKTIEDTGNDFAAGEFKVASPFAQFVVAPVAETGINVAPITRLEGGGAIKEPKPFLAFYNGLIGGNVYYTIGGSQTNKPLPHFSNAEKMASQVQDLSLSFGHPVPYHSVIATPLNGLYYRWWSKWANELFSSDARLLEAWFYLTPSDLAAFEWSDKIYLFNQYWRIIEIQGYDATQDGLTRVRFVKILGDIQDCEQLPDRNALGIIQGDPTSLSKKCCERYGYTFDPDTKRCYQPAPLTL